MSAVNSGGDTRARELERQRLIESIVREALEASSDRQRVLEERCGGDSDLRAAVELLLAPTEAQLDSFLSTPAARRRRAPEPASEIPTRIGGYEIIRKIGEGGMGIVYEARQDHPRRTVALKVIRPGMASRDLLRRFEHEAEILGQLQHPGIACIYEAGVAEIETPQRDGMRLPQARQPFFAMEFVQGRPITDYVGGQHLNIGQRLTLFAKACDAVHHAHQKGVIHRDLKPANILVVDQAGTQFAAPIDPQPKILDFGVARVTNADLQTVTLGTHMGQLIGTIPYMSPEQVTGDPRKLDVRSDVYALGVILYELLAERLPYNLQNCSIPESMRVIREEEPSRLSSVNTIFRGDVETIVNKALEKDKNRRYESAAELAADVRRFLQDEPIAARPASRYYRFRKFTRRHKALVFGSLSAFVCLLVGLVLALWQASIANTNARQARAQQELTQRQAYRASLAAAQAALRSDDVLLARRCLDDAAPPVRGWEWNYLNWQTESGIQSTPVGGAIHYAIPSTDASRALVALRDGHIQLWSTSPVRLVREYAGRNGASLAFSRDAHKALVGGISETSLWDAETGETLWRIAEPATFGETAFGPDGTWIAVLKSNERHIKLIDVATGKDIRDVAATGNGFGEVFASPDGSLVMLAEYRSEVFDVLNGASLCVSSNYGPRFMHDSKRILNGNMILDPRTCKTLKTIPASSDFRGSVERPDGTALALTDIRGVITLVDEGSLQPFGRLRVAPGETHFSADGQRILSGGNDGTIRLFNASFATLPLSVAPAAREELNCAAVGAAGMATGGWGCVALRNPATGAMRWRRTVTHQDVLSVAFSSDGKYLAAGCRRGRLALLEAESGRLLWNRVAGEVGDIVGVAFSPDGMRIFAGFSSGHVRATAVGLLAAGQAAVEWPEVFASSRRNVAALLMQSGGNLLVIGTGENPATRDQASVPGEGQLELWDLRDEQAKAPVRKLPARGAGALCIAVDRAGARIAAPQADGSVRVLRMADGQQLARLGGPTETLTSLCFSPDGARIAGGYEDGTVRIWDAETGQDLCGIREASHPIVGLGFTNDGKTLLASARQAALIALETGPADCAPTVREWNERARPIVNDLTDQYLTSDAVLAQVEKNVDLPPALRDAAIREVRAHGDNANWLNSDAWEICAKTGLSQEEYELSIRKAQMAVKLLPEAAFLNTLGTAQYRAGHYEEAIESLLRSERTFEQNSLAGQSANWAFIAMSQYKLGRIDEARATLSKSQELFRQSKPQTDEDRGLVREAEQLIAPDAGNR